MKTRFRLLLATALVALTALTASTAQASNGVSTSATDITASGSLTMTGGIVCNVTLNLTLGSSTIAKRAATFGGINAARSTITGCTGILAARSPNNTGTILTGITTAYRSFTGTLPNIDRININAPGAGFLLNTVAGSCLYGGTLDGISFNVSGGAISTVTFSGGTIPRVSGGGLCPTTGGITGTLTVTGTAPTVTLV